MILAVITDQRASQKQLNELDGFGANRIKIFTSECVEVVVEQFGRFVKLRGSPSVRKRPSTRSTFPNHFFDGLEKTHLSD